jgi:hypothetical protein
MANQRPLVPIYSTKGELAAFLSYPYIINQQSEWIGWVTPEREVFSVIGHYVGWLDKGPRILRQRSGSGGRPRQTPPPAPPPITAPHILRLAPMMPELLMGVMDVFDEAPQLLQPLDSEAEELN